MSDEKDESPDGLTEMERKRRERSQRDEQEAPKAPAEPSAAEAHAAEQAKFKTDAMRRTLIVTCNVIIQESPIVGAPCDFEVHMMSPPNPPSPDVMAIAFSHVERAGQLGRMQIEKAFGFKIPVDKRS